MGHGDVSRACLKGVMSRSSVYALSELYFPFNKGRQLCIHCSNSEWFFSKKRISVTQEATCRMAQIERKMDLITET